VPVVPGAEPYAADGGPVGAVLVHGFTGNPSSMRPWGEHLAAVGLTVRVPRLPGHGTRWQDLNDTTFQDWYAEAERAFDELKARCERVFVGGLSMGGTVTVALAERRAGELAGGVLVNPSLSTGDPRARLLPLVARLLPSMPPIGSDIKKPGVVENAYDRMPTRGALSLSRMWPSVLADAAKITDPLLVFRSTEDHVVPASSVDRLVAGATHTTVDVRALTNSYHVATLDNDAPEIFAESLAFMTGAA
jgi:carboxylesterase